MLAVVQRVSRASVTVEADNHHAAIEHGLCVLLGVEQGDSPQDATWMAKKLANLRIFSDDAQKMNRSVLDERGAILLVSQFTLAGDCRKGHRPSFVNAASPELGKALYEDVGQRLEREHHLPVKYGVFGGMMQVALVNEGPVTIILRSRDT
jgi:D-tyrosyl-tRNA(Tyr) deacylase